MNRLSTAGSRRDWLETFVSRCQAVAARASDAPGPSLSATVRLLAADLPANLTMAERLATRSQLTTVLARTMRSCGVDRRTDVLALFFAWAASDVSAATWCGDVSCFVAACANCVDSARALRPAADASIARPTASSTVGDSRVAAALQMIASHYSDPDLSLERVAAHARVSVWYVARLLKRFTGCGFTTHVHRTRVAASQRLLRDRTLCIKEIAAAVGYSTSSQFCLHFKRLVGTTPTRYRVAVAIARIAG